MPRPEDTRSVTVEGAAGYERWRAMGDVEYDDRPSLSDLYDGPLLIDPDDESFGTPPPLCPAGCGAADHPSSPC